MKALKPKPAALVLVFSRLDAGPLQELRLALAETPFPVLAGALPGAEELEDLAVATGGRALLKDLNTPIHFCGAQDLGRFSKGELREGKLHLTGQGGRPGIPARLLALNADYLLLPDCNSPAAQRLTQRCARLFGCVEPAQRDALRAKLSSGIRA